MTQIPENLFKRLDNLSRDLGFGIQMVNSIKPWLVSMTLLQLQLQKLVFQSELGIDLYFINRAKTEKEILELDSAEFQIKSSLSGMFE